MIFELMIVAGVAVLSAALRSFGHPVLFRLGTFGMVATSFLAGCLIGGSVLLGVIFAATYFFLPWVDILTRVRRMRFPLDRCLEPCAPPPRGSFPSLEELSDEMESLGFEYLEDANWKDANTRQFYRLFYNGESRILAAICLVEQNEFAFYYVALTGRTPDGGMFLTWNYPFSYGLHMHPKVLQNRVTGEKSIGELVALHGEFLASRNVASGDLCNRNAEGIRMELQGELREQLDHNINLGILKREEGRMIRYSLRGMFFLWVQFLRDFVRFS